LNAHGAGGVGGRSVNRMRVHSMDESRGVVEVEGTWGCDTFSPENGHGELLTEPTVAIGREEVCWCVNINHRHSKAAGWRRGLDILTDLAETIGSFWAGDFSGHAV